MLGAEEPDLGSLVRFQPILKVLGEVEGIPRRRVDGVGCRQADGPMVGMERVGPERIMGDDDVRFVRADHAHDLLAQVQVRHERAVRAAEEDDLVHAEPARRLQHLALSNAAQARRVEATS